MTTSTGHARPKPADRALRKIIALGIHVFAAWSRLAYRLAPPWRGKLGHADHVTIPCQDLAIAEEFYVGLLGAKVALRLDAPRLERLGWSRPDIERNHAAETHGDVANGQ